MVRHPRGRYLVHGTPTAVSGSCHTGNKINPLKLSSVCKSVPQAGFSRMKLTLHATRRTPHGASRLVHAMSVWSVKTRHAPSRHCRDARVYGHTTTAMNEIEYTRPSPPHPRHPRNCLLKAPAAFVCVASVTSHPTVGVALFGPKVSDQLSSFREAPPVRMKHLLVYSFLD